jgi:hypothetical protein
MLSSIFIALFQAVSGDPAVAAATETPAAEAPAASAEEAPRTERRRVCRTYEAATGGRLSQRRCRYVEVPVRDGNAPAADEVDATAATDTDASTAEASDAATAGAAAAPAPPAPQ